ncbi:hypothetical protein ACQR50_14115 [Sphingomonas sp. Xoc002]|uniref:hypothetical protein n=1 Tax=Sphingomonas sp. Xoc002 TaxID=2837624 RepID=UPI003D168B84
MSGSEDKTLFVLLRQVDGPRWCVIRQVLSGKKLSFFDRLATARPYGDAARVAINSAKKMGLTLVIQADGQMPRRFNYVTDAVRPGGVA